MSGPGTAPVRPDDRGMFKPNGLFEFVYDERPNSLPAADTMEKQLRFQESRRLKEDELLELIRQARNRPRFKDFRRLKELARKANLQKEMERSRTDPFNLSMKEYLYNTSDRANQILFDLSNFSTMNKSLYQIFTEGDRLIYIGSVIVVMSFLILLIIFLE